MSVNELTFCIYTYTYIHTHSSINSYTINVFVFNIGSIYCIGKKCKEYLSSSIVTLVLVVVVVVVIYESLATSSVFVVGNILQECDKLIQYASTPLPTPPGTTP